MLEQLWVNHDDCHHHELTNNNNKKKTKNTPDGHLHIRQRKDMKSYFIEVEIYLLLWDGNCVICVICHNCSRGVFKVNDCFMHKEIDMLLKMELLSE